MKLYGAIASPYVSRVVMFARLKGIELKLENAPGGMGSDEYRSINPIGKIPALVVDGRTIPESDVICEYLEDTYPATSGLPGSPIERATSRMISRIVDLYIAPSNGAMARQIEPGTRDHSVVDQHRQALAQGFSYLEHFMGTGPFAVGCVPTLGDCAAGSYMMLIKKMLVPIFADVPDPTLGEGRLATWWAALNAHEICARSIDEYATAVDGFMKFVLERVKP